LLLALAQAAVLLAEPAHGIEQTIHLLAQGGQLLLDRVNMVWRAHARNYSRTPADFRLVAHAAGSVRRLH